MAKLSSLKKLMKSNIAKGEILGIADNAGKAKLSNREKNCYDYGYGMALKDVLENFFLETKVKIDNYRKDLEEMIGRIKESFPDAIVSMDYVTNYVPDYMASLGLDVYMVAQNDILPFEDLVDELSLSFWQKTKLSIVIMCHTVDDTEKFYPKVLEKERKKK